MKWNTIAAVLATLMAAALAANVLAAESDVVDHPKLDGAQLRYEGAPLQIKDVKMQLTPGAPDISPEEYQRAAQIFFERCAGCHGVLRKGATGKPLTPDITQQRGSAYLKVLINFGTPAGMPNWGSSGDMTDAEVDAMARFLQHPPPEPPEFGLEDMRKSWRSSAWATSARSMAMCCNCVWGLPMKFTKRSLPVSM